MDAYVVGNLAGRLVLSYLVMWCLMLAFSRADWRRALRRSYRWYGIALTLVFFSAGLVGAMR